MLPEKQGELLLSIYRGKTRSLACVEFEAPLTALAKAWDALRHTGLIDAYDCFGGYLYCHITEKGERAAEKIIAARASA